jgi:hypothetical protein
MHQLSHPAPALAQSNDTVYRFRLNGWMLVLICQCLVMALPILKLLHVSPVSSWSWLWVTLPLWSPSVLLALVLGVEQLASIGKAKEGSLLVGTCVANG